MIGQVHNTFNFVGGSKGDWEVTRIATVRGPALENAARIKIVQGDASPVTGAAWVLRGVTSNARYATRTELDTLRSIQPSLARAEAVCAALIPIRKSAAWWDMAQDERRAIFEDDSRHTATGLRYLPQIARRLHHSRDLGEPFDFLTWFEFAPEHESDFDALVAELRASAEWRFVEREVDVRLRACRG